MRLNFFFAAAADLMLSVRVVIVILATRSKPNVRNACARTPQANPTLLFIKLFSIMG